MAQKVSDIIPISNLKDYKVHCAVINPEFNVEPLVDFFNGRWNCWNEHKTRRDDFNRKYIFSMMRFYPDGDDIWLFGGIFEVNGIKKYREKGKNIETYIITPSDKGKEYIGKLKICYLKVGKNGNSIKQPRLCLEKFYHQFDVKEILEKDYRET